MAGHSTVYKFLWYCRLTSVPCMSTSRTCIFLNNPLHPPLNVAFRWDKTEIEWVWHCVYKCSWHSRTVCTVNPQYNKPSYECWINQQFHLSDSSSDTSVECWYPVSGHLSIPPANGESLWLARTKPQIHFTYNIRYSALQYTQIVVYNRTNSIYYALQRT